MFDSIDRYEGARAVASKVTDQNIQKQLLNYKLQHKILLDLLRKVLDGDQSDYKASFSPVIVHQIINKVLNEIELLIGENGSREFEIQRSQEDQENLTILTQINQIREEPNLLKKLQSFLGFFLLLTTEINTSFENLRVLFEQQSQKTGYLQFLIESQLKRSSEIITNLAQPTAVKSEDKDNLIKISNLNYETNNLNEALHSKDLEIEKLKDDLASIKKLVRVQHDLWEKEREAVEQKHAETIHHKDQIIAELRAQLEGRRPTTPGTDYDSSGSFGTETNRIQEIDHKLSEIQRLTLQENVSNDRHQIHVISNYDGQDSGENILVETISLLNRKLIEKNELFMKMNASVQGYLREIGEWRNERIDLKKNLMGQQSQLAALTEKVETLNQNLHHVVGNFHFLLTLNLDTYKFFCSVIGESVDLSSFEQVQTKIQKLEKLNSKLLNFDKIFYYAQAVHRYFEDIVEALHSDHRKVLLDAEEKQRMDGNKIKELTETNNNLKKALQRMKAELENTMALRDEVNQLRVENNEMRQLNMSSLRALMSAEDAHNFNQSAKDDARVEELTKRWKAERERRVQDHKSAQRAIESLEQENEALRNKFAGRRSIAY